MKPTLSRLDNQAMIPERWKPKYVSPTIAPASCLEFPGPGKGWGKQSETCSLSGLRSWQFRWAQAGRIPCREHQRGVSTERQETPRDLQRVAEEKWAEYQWKHMCVGKVFKARARTTGKHGGNGVSNSHGVKNSACSHQPDRKTHDLWATGQSTQKGLVWVLSKAQTKVFQSYTVGILVWIIICYGIFVLCMVGCLRAPLMLAD